MDISSYTRFIAALLFVLALIGALAWIGRRAGLVARVTARSQNKSKRLDVIEVLTVDAGRRLVLLRRDNVEHLVLLGGQRDTLIETGIETGISPAPTAPPQEPRP
jgi:flagellar protein FliO/FliZ